MTSAENGKAHLLVSSSANRLEVPATNEKLDRLNNINRVISEHGLAHPFTLEGIGDLDRQEAELLGAEEVIPLGNEGLSLVRLPAQFTKDSIDPETGLEKKGARGAFWTFFNTVQAEKDNGIYIPFVEGVPGNFEVPEGTRHSSRNINRINQVLAEHKLKTLPPTANAATEQILGIADIVTNNERFFKVVVYRVRDVKGNVTERPYVYNANSISGFDGTVFSTVVRAEQYGNEPRFIVGDSYRPNLGKWVKEVPRGFYSPRHGGEEKVELKAAFTNVPILRRAIEEISDETGLLSADALVDAGKIMQDPSFEASSPNYFNIDVEAPEFQPQDLEASEKLRLNFMSAGEVFSQIPNIQDPFTLTAISRHLLKSDALRLSKRGMDAANDGERVMLVQQFRPQMGVFTLEAMRGNNEKIKPDYTLGELPVNSGIARIMPELFYKDLSWKDFSQGSDKGQLRQVRAYYPYELLQLIENGRLDSVTTGSLIKALHAKGYLTLNMAGLAK